MATKSMLKNVDIKEKYIGRKFVEALEEAVTYKRKSSKKNINCEEVEKDCIKALLG